MEQDADDVAREQQLLLQQIRHSSHAIGMSVMSWLPADGSQGICQRAC